MAGTIFLNFRRGCGDDRLDNRPDRPYTSGMAHSTLTFQMRLGSGDGYSLDEPRRRAPIQSIRS